MINYAMLCDAMLISCSFIIHSACTPSIIGPLTSVSVGFRLSPVFPVRPRSSSPAVYLNVSRLLISSAFTSSHVLPSPYPLRGFIH